MAISLGEEKKSLTVLWSILPSSFTQQMLLVASIVI